MLNGACLCGRVQYEISSKPLWMYRCYCGKCRAASGSAFVTNIIVEADHFRITTGHDDLAAFESSSQKHRYFCSVCGSPIYSHGEKTKQVVSVRSGTLSQDPGLRVAYHAFVASKAPWVDISDDQPQFPEWPDPMLIQRLITASTRA